MSQDATFGQATHTLTLIDQQKPSTQDLKVLHDGYLADLLRAIKLGKVPARPDFQKFLGLLPDLNIWKTITLGLHKSPEDYRMAIEKDGYRISEYADRILNKMEISQIEVELDLVVLSIDKLGFPKGARRDAIYDSAKKLGLQLCPAEVGPALRLAYKDQPRGDWLRIGMEPITDSDGFPFVCEVDHGNDVRWLPCSHDFANFIWSAYDKWVFVRPRKKA